MKKLIKFFSATIFIVCFLPCFQMCKSNVFYLDKKKESKTIITQSLSPEVLKFKNDSIKERKKQIRKEWSFNAYEIGIYSYGNLEIKDLKNWSLYTTVCFTIFILSSVLVFYSALKECLVNVYRLSLLNLALLFCALLIFIIKEHNDFPSQIRYGYYLLVSNILILILLSKREISRNIS